MDSVTESPTSRPSPEKQRADVSKPSMKSVVIARPLFLVWHVGIGAPQMSMKEAIKKYGDPEINSEASPVPSGTVTATTTPTPHEPVEEEKPRPPAFLPPSEDVSGSVAANDAKRIWKAAEFFHAHMYAAKRQTPPSNPDQRIVAQYSIAAHVTRGL